MVFLVYSILQFSAPKMRKEVIVAIVIGFALGLVITFGVWTANRALKERQVVTPPPTGEITPVAQITPAPSFSLEIISPEDQSLLSQAKISLSGKTQAGSTVVVISEKTEDIVEVAEDGTFTSEVALVGGTNEITVIAFSPEGEEVTKNLYLVYSTVEI